MSTSAFVAAQVKSFIDLMVKKQHSDTETRTVEASMDGESHECATITAWLKQRRRLPPLYRLQFAIDGSAAQTSSPLPGRPLCRLPSTFSHRTQVACYMCVASS